MLELLDTQKGDTVLDIGSGSGWMTALLGHMVGSEGKVIGLEIIPSLVEHAQSNIQKYKHLPMKLYKLIRKRVIIVMHPMIGL